MEFRYKNKTKQQGPRCVYETPYHKVTKIDVLKCLTQGMCTLHMNIALFLAWLSLQTCTLKDKPKTFGSKSIKTFFGISKPRHQNIPYSSEVCRGALSVRGYINTRN